jgi:hypothetical protein
MPAFRTRHGASWKHDDIDVLSSYIVIGVLQQYSCILQSTD